MQDTASKIYNEGYKDGFQQGFLSFLTIEKNTDKKSSKSEDFLKQKKAARDWAESMGYLKPKKPKSSK